MERGIDVGALSANFRDAIIITRLLGIRYLWIDSVHLPGLPARLVGKIIYNGQNIYIYTLRHRRYGPSNPKRWLLPGSEGQNVSGTHKRGVMV